MEMNEYQKECLRTTADEMDEKTKNLVWALAIAGEAGELANRVKKTFVHEHPMEKEKLAEELGDILWYIAVYAHDLGYSLSEIGERNVAKLWRRYPDGFSADASLHRKD